MSERRFGTKAAAARAVKKQGLQAVPHTFDEMFDMYRGWRVTFTCELPEDAAEIRSRGFRAVVEGVAQ